MREDDPQAGGLVRRDPIEPRAIQGETAGVGPLLARDQAEQRRLSGAIGPDDAERLAGFDLERYRVEGDRPAIALGQIADA
jgi:hypothetical protein